VRMGSLTYKAEMGRQRMDDAMQTADVSRGTIYSLSIQQGVNGNSSGHGARSAASSNPRVSSWNPASSCIISSID